MPKILKNGETIRVTKDGKILCVQCHEYLPAEKFAPMYRDGWGICKYCFTKRR